MVKLFSGIVIICALVTEVSTLKCYQCASPLGNCSQQVVCNPAGNYKCTTTAITVTNANQVEENTALNGVECYACHNGSVATCTSSTSIVKCVGIQNRCAYTYIQLPVSGQHAVVKGCVSESICKSLRSPFFGVQTNSEIQCCHGNLCNKETILPGRRCYSCIGVSGVCSSKPIQCISSSCTVAAIKQVISGTSQEFVVKGCGNCFGSLSFNAGPFSVERADRCCQSENCNNQTVTVEANTNLNGLVCYGCTPFSNQNCSDAKIMVNCIGKQTRCLHSSTTGKFQQIGTIKGCASESICNNPDVLKFYGLQPKKDFYCCNESGCNLGDGSSGLSTAHSVTLILPLIHLILCLF